MSEAGQTTDAEARRERLRVLACGGRDFADRAMLEAALDGLHAEAPVAVLIHGAARGADRLAAAWARSRGVAEHAFPAEWERDGRRAGFLRNARMLREGAPDLVVAFPGGAGTADMVRQGRRARVPVWEP